MDLDEARAVVAERYHAMLATLPRDGTRSCRRWRRPVQRVLLQIGLTSAGPDRGG